MKLGVNIHRDWHGCPNLHWLKEHSYVRRVRVDFPYMSIETPSTKLHFRNVLTELQDMEEIVFHAGYVKDISKLSFLKYHSHLVEVCDELEAHGLADKTILELWNNVNIYRYWRASKKEFVKLMDFIKPSLDYARSKGIRLAGFSFTLNIGHDWRWIKAVRGVLETLDYTTIQLYPRHSKWIEEKIKRFESTYPNLDYIIAEVGFEARAEKQFCCYTHFMRDLQDNVPNKSVYLYHLFDAKKENGWGLISWGDSDKPPFRKPAASYITDKTMFPVPLPERCKCYKKRNWLAEMLHEISVFFKNLFR